MGAVASFNYKDFVAAFPELSGLTSSQAAAYFSRATMFLRNDGSGPVCDVTTQTNLLYLLTAHLALMSAPRDASGNVASVGTAAPSLVGRISNATEGSVSVQIENDYAQGTVQWYQQTRYGSEFWAASQAYRAFKYVPRKTRVVDGPLSPFYRR